MAFSCPTAAAALGMGVLSRRVRGSAQRSRAARRRSLRGDSPSLGAVARVFVGRAKWRCCGFACSRRRPAAVGARATRWACSESLERAGGSHLPRGSSEELQGFQTIVLSVRQSGARRIRAPKGAASTSTPYLSQNALVRNDASPGVGQPTTEYQYIQYKHRTPCTPSPRRAKEQSAHTLVSPQQDVPGSASAAPASLAQDGPGASKANAPKAGQAEEERPARPARAAGAGRQRQSGVADLLSKKTELTNSALDDKSGTRAIHIACKNGDKDMIRELMKRNCFLNQKDSEGMYGADAAAAAGHDKIVKLIVDGGADVG